VVSEWNIIIVLNLDQLISIIVLDVDKVLVEWDFFVFLKEEFEVSWDVFVKLKLLSTMFPHFFIFGV
jgi:hypothetical protein